MPNNKPKFIIANWKMNPSNFAEASNILNIAAREIKSLDAIKVIICPPSVYLAKIKPASSFELGIQNIFWEDKGAYTGEISPLMAKNLGVKYAIVGHSERRIFLKEDDEMIGLKVKAALRNNITPVLCVGETLKEKRQDEASKVIINQLKSALKDVPKFHIPYSKFIIAYEPIWAIGTGETPTYDEIMSMNLLIKKTILNIYDRETAEKTPILYGGSVDSGNAFDIVEKTGADGLLIGGASINASEFVRIADLFVFNNLTIKLHDSNPRNDKKSVGGEIRFWNF